MRKITGFGQPILLSEAAYKSLKKKWRHENITQKVSWYGVDGECPYCKKNMKTTRCNLRCPLQANFPQYSHGCLRLMRIIAQKHSVVEPVSITTTGASWRSRDEAESFVEAVEGVLNTAKRVKK